MTAISRGFVVQSKSTGLTGIVIDEPSVSKAGPFPGKVCCTVVFAVAGIPVQVVCKPDSLRHAEMDKGEHLAACRTACR